MFESPHALYDLMYRIIHVNTHAHISNKNTLTQPGS